MPTIEYCSYLGCWLNAGHRGGHVCNGIIPGQQSPLTCQCAQPRPNWLDECMNPKCRRVIAERVKARRDNR